MSELTKRLRDRIIYASLRNDKTGSLEMREIRDPLCAEAADRIEALEECLRECADDLECELDARYPKSVRAYACMESDYQRDMSPVYKARALLDEK